MTRWSTLAALVAACGVLAAGCGSSDGDSSKKPSPKPTKKSAKVISFAPNDAEFSDNELAQVVTAAYDAAAKHAKSNGNFYARQDSDLGRLNLTLQAAVIKAAPHARPVAITVDEDNKDIFGNCFDVQTEKEWSQGSIDSAKNFKEPLGSLRFMVVGNGDGIVLEAANASGISRIEYDPAKGSDLQTTALARCQS